MDAAVVELDALADSVRATAEDDDLFVVCLAGFVFVAVGGVVVWCVGFKFSCAGVNESVGRDDSFFFALCADVVLVAAAGMGDLVV